eukprot:TRINITY_DN16328_c0_g1_i1.p1 TRINITY_DN16328_c0_g1~~TRINITY_DN16328_c0_g1_i1.p1  ORF type:complete len:1520 (-),score=177.95 TRINITY_DN16328_c0_g1_i1:32-4591(-)
MQALEPGACTPMCQGSLDVAALPTLDGSAGVMLSPLSDSATACTVNIRWRYLTQSEFELEQLQKEANAAQRKKENTHALIEIISARDLCLPLSASGVGCTLRCEPDYTFSSATAPAVVNPVFRHISRIALLNVMYPGELSITLHDNGADIGTTKMPVLTEKQGERWYPLRLSGPHPRKRFGDILLSVTFVNEDVLQSQRDHTHAAYTTCHFEIVEARSLTTQKNAGQRAPYPFCVFRLSAQDKPAWRTHPVAASDCPTWRETFFIDVTDPSEQLHLEVRDHDRLGEADRHLGFATIDLLGQPVAGDQWVTLRPEPNSAEALQLIYFNNGSLGDVLVCWRWLPRKDIQELREATQRQFTGVVLNVLEARRLSAISDKSVRVTAGWQRTESCQTTEPRPATASPVWDEELSLALSVVCEALLLHIATEGGNTSATQRVASAVFDPYPLGSEGERWIAFQPFGEVRICWRFIDESEVISRRSARLADFAAISVTPAQSHSVHSTLPLVELRFGSEKPATTPHGAGSDAVWGQDFEFPITGNEDSLLITVRDTHSFRSVGTVPFDPLGDPATSGQRWLTLRPRARAPAAGPTLSQVGLAILQSPMRAIPQDKTGWGLGEIQLRWRLVSFAELEQRRLRKLREFTLLAVSLDLFTLVPPPGCTPLHRATATDGSWQLLLQHGPYSNTTEALRASEELQIDYKHQDTFDLTDSSDRLSITLHRLDIFRRSTPVATATVDTASLQASDGNQEVVLTSVSSSGLPWGGLLHVRWQYENDSVVRERRRARLQQYSSLRLVVGSVRSLVLPAPGEPGGTRSVFTTLTLGSVMEKSRVAEVAANTAEWNQHFELPLSRPSDRLVCALWERNKAAGDKCLGQVDVDVAGDESSSGRAWLQLIPGRTEHPLEGGERNVAVGELLVSWEFVAEGELRALRVSKLASAAGLTVQLIEARLLSPIPEVYAVAAFGAQDTRSTVAHGRYPAWNETLDFDLLDAQAILRIEFFEGTPEKPKHRLGSVLADVGGEVELSGERWFQLRGDFVGAVWPPEALVRWEFVADSDRRHRRQKKLEAFTELEVQVMRGRGIKGPPGTVSLRPFCTVSLGTRVQPRVSWIGNTECPLFDSAFRFDLERPNDRLMVTVAAHLDTTPGSNIVTTQIGKLELDITGEVLHEGSGWFPLQPPSLSTSANDSAVGELQINWRFVNARERRANFRRRMESFSAVTVEVLQGRGIRALGSGAHHVRLSFVNAERATRTVASTGENVSLGNKPTNNTVAPYWNETFEFDLASVENTSEIVIPKLRVRVFDHDTTRGELISGCTELDILGGLKDTSAEWVHLQAQFSDGGHTNPSPLPYQEDWGEILLRFSFVDEALRRERRLREQKARVYSSVRLEIQELRQPALAQPGRRCCLVFTLGTVVRRTDVVESFATVTFPDPVEFSLQNPEEKLLCQLMGSSAETNEFVLAEGIADIHVVEGAVGTLVLLLRPPKGGHTMHREDLPELVLRWRYQLLPPRVYDRLQAQQLRQLLNR